MKTPEKATGTEMQSLVDTAAKGAIGSVVSLAKDLVLQMGNLGRAEIAKLSVEFETGFRNFVDRNYRQFSRIKTLLSSATPMSLEATFESPFLRVGDDLLDEDSFLDLLERENFAVITGLGGSGKSVLLKHFFIRYYNEGRGRVPFLIELRNLPKGDSLKSYMISLIQAVVPKMNDSLFEYALRRGKFIFLLDGFDEVDFDRRSALAAEVIDFTYGYGNNLLVVTSRPDPVFQSWSEFHSASIEGFTKTQVISLVKKVKYDNAVKKAFLTQIKDKGLYESHSSYLSNPLLCNIMILTFDHGAEVPNKMHLFFGQTFDVLFYRHDATKGTSYRRKFHTSLSIDEFRTAFSAFSAFTYMDHGPTVTHSQALSSARRSIEYCRLDQKADDFVNDLCSSVSLMVREGDNFSYIHRTFQEYFFAQFLSGLEVEGWDGVLERLLRDKPNDTVIKLLSDINRDRFEQEFLAPRIQKLCDDLNVIDVNNNPAEVFLLFYFDFSARGDATGSRISSWTVGKETSYPRHYYIMPFIREDDAVRILDGFDWKAHILKFYPGHDDDFEVTLEEPTDKMLLGTPMVQYLSMLKETANKMNQELAYSASVQKRLLSETLFRSAI